MSLIDALSDTNSKATDLGEKYFKTSYKYYKLKLFQQLSISIGLVFKTIAIGGLVLLGLAFLAVGLALFIGSMLGSYALGFVVIGASFLLVSCIAFIFRKHISNVAVKKLSKKFFN